MNYTYLILGAIAVTSVFVPQTAHSQKIDLSASTWLEGLTPAPENRTRKPKGFI